MHLSILHLRYSEGGGQILYDSKNVNLIYTGAIDELFDYKFGVLPYRSLHFVFKSMNVNSFQNVAIVAYPQAEGYTRITEYTKMPKQNCSGWTDVAYEYPVKYDRNAQEGNEPYYPVLTKDSLGTYQKYRDYADKFTNLTLCGRLADFQYYNMDQVVLKTLKLYENMEIE